MTDEEYRKMVDEGASISVAMGILAAAVALVVIGSATERGAISLSLGVMALWVIGSGFTAMIVTAALYSLYHYIRNREF